MANMGQQILITCDRVVKGKQCNKTAATYTLTGPNGDTWEIDLCDEHAEPVWGVATREGRVPYKADSKRRTLQQQVRPFTPLED